MTVPMQIRMMSQESQITFSLHSETRYFYRHLFHIRLTNSLEKDLGQIENIIESQKISKILDWLRKNVHHYGRSLDSEELVKKVSGTTLSPQYFLEYLEKKVDKISNICN